MNLSYFQATNALPFFVIEDHPKFVKFLQSYYEWVNINNSLLRTYSERNIDLSSMPEEKWKAYAHNIPISLLSNKEWVIRFLKEFYGLKGTEASFDFFTRIVWNLPSTLFYTKEQLLKSSNSSFKTQKVIYAKSNQDLLQISLFELEGQVLEGSTFKLYIDEVYKCSEYYILVCDRIVGKLSNTDTITFLKQYQVKSVEGVDLEEGDVIVDPYCAFQINSISYGIVENVTIQEKGVGYKVGDPIRMITSYRGYGFYGEVAEVDDVGGIVSVEVIHRGFGVDRNDVKLQVESEMGKQAVLTPIIQGFGDVKSISMLSSNVCVENVERQVVRDGLLKYTLIPVDYNSLSYFERQNGRFLFDSEYYTNHTYEVRVEGDVDEDLIRTMLHLCGLKMFVHKQNAIEL